MRALDAARTNLGAGITALRRLGLLAAATDQLGAAAERGDLAAATPLVDAVTELGAHFQAAAAGGVPAVEALAGRAGRLRAGLTAAATRAFELLPAASAGEGGGGGGGLPPELLARLGEAARVLRAVGGRAPDAAVSAVCARELGAYQQIFWAGATGGGGGGGGGFGGGEGAPPPPDLPSLPTSGPAAALARTERRFAWLRARLRSRAALWAVLPPEWRSEEALCLAFARVTRGQLAEVLEAAGGGRGAAAAPSPASPAAHVEALLLAVKAANDWEAEMEDRFGGGGVPGRSAPTTAAGLLGGDDWPDDEAPASRVRARAEAAARARAAAAAGAGSAAAGGAVAAAEAAGRGGSGAPASSSSSPAPSSPFRGAISSVFEPHLAAYVAAEEAALAATLASLLATPGAWDAPPPGDAGVLPAGPALFAALKRALTRCARHVSRGGGLLSLAAAFQRVLGGYAGAMRARVPGPAGPNNPGPPSAASFDWCVRVGADADLARLGALVSTAEYCARVCGELAGAVRRTVDPAALAASKAAVGAGRARTRAPPPVPPPAGGGGAAAAPPPSTSGPQPLVLDLGALDEDGGGAAFEGVAAAASAAGAAALLTRLEPWLASVARTHWAGVEDVGDASAAAANAARGLSSGAGALAPTLPALHWRFVADRTLAGAGPLLLGAVRGARAVSEPGAQQLLLEVGVIRGALAGLGNAGGEVGEGDSAAASTPSTAAAAARAAAPTEALLKVVGARPAAVAATFAAVMPGGSRSDLVGALELKAGLGRAEAGSILSAAFGGGAASSPPAAPAPRAPAAPPPQHPPRSGGLSPPPPPVPPVPPVPLAGGPVASSPGLPSAAAAARRLAHAAVPGPRAAAAVERAREAMRGLGGLGDRFKSGGGGGNGGA